MRRRLLILVAEAGGAEFLRPLVAAWRESPPDFEYRLGCAGPAADILGRFADSGERMIFEIDREDGRVFEALCSDAWVPDGLLVSAGGWPCGTPESSRPTSSASA